MSKTRSLLLVGILAPAIFGAAGSARAQTIALSNPQSLASLVNSYEFSRYAASKAPSTGSATAASLRGGAMVSPRGAGLVGVDISLPNVAIAGTGWHGRLDADAIIVASFSGERTVVPFTFNMMYYDPNAAAGHNVYFGAGLGAIVGKGSKIDGKLILGTEVTRTLAGEFNLHLTDGNTLFMILGRLHL